ncbi:hypothetical protein [Dyella tabacisoli]|uniref:hypothetical protein n=1 Tax=Dyella tabacisoli TaxID=2282381 RepID=UPI0013B3B0FF|nr:hypothetical protein [Dyella tabacisoli]
MSGISVNLSEIHWDDIGQWIKGGKIGADPYIGFLYSPDEPCIVCEFNFAMANMDTAFWRAPGRRYIFGCSFVNDELITYFSHFAEYSESKLIASF